jgi:hypothetical protein
MKRNNLQIIKCALLCFASLATIAARYPAEPDEGAELDAVVSVIREALKEAQSNNVPGFPGLKNASITLKTTVTKGGGLKINFLVFTIGAKYESEAASTLTLEMAPPPTIDAATLSSATDTEKLKQLLARAINSAKEGVLNANQGTPKLITSKIEIEVKFAVSKEGAAGGKVELLPVGAEGTGKLAYNKVHSLKLTFGR